MIRTGYENFDITSAEEPIWMKDERYGYCEDFYMLCSNTDKGFFSKLRKIPAMLMSALVR